MTSRRLKLVVSYDGRDFAGWQSQTNGNTIQDHIEAAVEKISGERTRVIGAGRTDAGVHALGQCAHVDLSAELSAERWHTALNALLPPMIRIMRARFVSADFHARFSAKAKVYRYRIVNSAVMSPFERGRAWQVRQRLDRSILERAARLFIGRHNFASFAATRSKSDENATRTIDSIRVRSRSDLIVIDVSAAGFLYKMVRLITGALVRCAAGKDDIDSVRLRLANVSPSWPRVAAPAHGLYLVRVVY